MAPHAELQWCAFRFSFSNKFVFKEIKRRKSAQPMHRVQKAIHVCAILRRQNLELKQNHAIFFEESRTKSRKKMCTSLLVKKVQN